MMSETRVGLRLREFVQSNPGYLYQRMMTGRYDKPIIVDDGCTRQLYFDGRFVQSSMRLDDPFDLDLAYTRKMMAFLLFVPDPGHLLMVGLGGGSLAKFCHRHLPQARLTVVEVNPHVIALRGQFNIPDDNRLTIIQADAADYLPVAEGDSDVLLLDGCDADGIAPMFLNRTFYQSARRRLRPSGMLVANFVGAPHDWRQHLALLDEIFEHRVYLARVSCEDNHIAFAFADVGYPLDWMRLEARATALACQVPLDFPALVKRLRVNGECWMAMRHLAYARPSIR